MTIFTLENEPFLGRESVYHFDQMLCVLGENADMLAPLTLSEDLDAWQKVVVDILPGAASIAFSIRELVRQGYLYGAATLRRSLFERSVRLQFIRNNSEAMELWSAGWPFNRRPSLNKMIEAITTDDFSSVEDYVRKYGSKSGFGKHLTSHLNAIVHGDPLAVLVDEMEHSSGKPMQRFPKQLGDQTLCDDVCFCSAMDVIVIVAMALDAFPRSR